MIDIFFLISVLIVMFLMINKSNLVNAGLILFHGILTLLFTIYSSLSALTTGKIHLSNYVSLMKIPHSFAMTSYFMIDDLNVIFLLITGVLYAGISLYNYQFIRFSEEDARRNNNYSIGVIIFVCSIIGLIMSSHMALLWVFLELSTLSSTFLIIYQKNRHSLEAGWKYIFICSIGIALAFFGIILLTIGLGEHNSLFFNDLYQNAKLINPFWLKLSFIFILIGMGTKMGLAPVHTWLPDAHSEAPSPISALLSGGLLNVAFLGIIRFHKIMKLSGYGNLSTSLLMLMGFFSIIVCAIYIFRVKNYKRMFAYSSIENMGIIAIGSALGGIAFYAALLHMLAHSLSKGAVFLTAGNILHNTKTKNIKDIHGLAATDPINAWLLLLSFLSLSGIPPFPIFMSELMMIKSMLITHPFYTVMFVLLLTIVIAGMGKNVFSMVFGEKMTEYCHRKEHFMAYLPQILFIVCLLVLGVYLPGCLHKVITYAAFSI
jgi:hydrogenase-4 component F